MDRTAVQVAATPLRAAWLLSGVIVVLMVASSVAGLWVDGLYRDPASVTAMLRGYDLVTLVVVAPALAIALLPRLRRSPRAQLVWLGLLGYSVYNYAIYVFGSAFNDVFLVHVALFTASVSALVLASAIVDVARLANRFHPRTPVRSISGLLLLLAVGLGSMWVFYSLRFAISGETPAESELVLPIANVHLAYVLDLALLVPGYALAAVLLWRRAAWGYLLATVLFVYSVVYQLNYLTALIFQANADVPGATGFDPVEPFIVGVILVGAGVMLGFAQPEKR